MTTGTIGRAKQQLNHHHQQANTQFFTGWMSFLSPNQQCQSTEWKPSQLMNLEPPRALIFTCSSVEVMLSSTIVSLFVYLFVPFQDALPVTQKQCRSTEGTLLFSANQMRCKHCAMAVARPSQKILPRRRPPPRVRRTAEI